MYEHGNMVVDITASIIAQIEMGRVDREDMQQVLDTVANEVLERSGLDPENVFIIDTFSMVVGAVISATNYEYNYIKEELGHFSRLMPDTLVES